MGNECVFCGFDKQYVIEETEYSIATYSMDAIRKGHIILAVKEHVTTFTDLKPAQAADIFELALRTAKRAEEIIGAEKYYIVSIADMVRHFHVHLLPKMPGDPPIGRHIMGDEGWKGQVGETLAEKDIIEFIKIMRGDFHENK
jgi:diadenosine tetraphosphate (Ap4A) HIT family hydrolase